MLTEVVHFSVALSYLHFPLIGSGLVKFLPQRTGDYCGLEGAGARYHHLVALYFDRDVGFDSVSHCAHGHAHTCGEHKA